MAHKLTKILHALLFTPLQPSRDGKGWVWGLPALAIGTPGTAKTGVVGAVARRCVDWGFKDLSPASDGEGAYGVVPMGRTDEHGDAWLTYPAPEWAQCFAPDDGEPRGVLFLDEINRGGPALLAASLKIPLERKIGGRYLGDRVRVLSAMNPPDDAANATGLDDASATRYVHIAWPSPTVEEWAEFMLSGMAPMPQIDPVAEEERVLNLWPAAWATAASLTTGFVKARPDLLDVPPKEPEQIGKPRPNPRTWHLATCILAGAEIHGLSEREVDDLLAGTIGAAATTELVAWIAAQDLPNPADLLDGAAAFAHDVKRPDRTIAVLDACIALITPTDCPKRKPRMAAAWALIKAIMPHGKDLVAVAAIRLNKLCQGDRITADRADVIREISALVEAAKGVC